MEVNLELMSFIETIILPKYNDFDPAHSLVHVQRVIASSLILARKLGADIDMVYAIAAYHDLGMSGPRAIHHVTGGKILAADKRLAKWFSPEQVKIMREAVEDHRASASHEPRSIYGKIVAEADRDLQPDIVFTRAIQFGLGHYSELGEEEQYTRFRNHVSEKYGNGGYLRLGIPNSPNEQYLKEVREIINDKTKLRGVFDKHYAKLKDQ